MASSRERNNKLFNNGEQLMTNTLLQVIVNNTKLTLPSYYSPDEVSDLIADGLIVGNPDQPHYDSEGNITGRIPFWATEAGVAAVTPLAPVGLIPAPQQAPEVISPEPSTPTVPSAVAPVVVPEEIPQVVTGKGQLVSGIAKKERNPRTKTLNLEKMSVGDYIFIKNVKPKNKSAVVSKANKHFRDEGVITKDQFAIETYYAEAGEEVFAGVIMPVAGTYIYRIK